MKAGRRDGVGRQGGLHYFNGRGFGAAGDLHAPDHLARGYDALGRVALGIATVSTGRDDQLNGDVPHRLQNRMGADG